MNIWTKIIIGIIVVVTITILDIIVFPVSYNKLSFIQRQTAKRIVKKWGADLKKLPKEKVKIISQEEIMGSLNILEKIFVNRILVIKPNVLGFKGPYFSTDAISGLKNIPQHEIILTDKKKDTGINFLPASVNGDYERMMQAMDKDINKTLFVNSGYRSPGYQTYLFFYYLVTENGYSLYENAKWIAMPGYSEHNSPNTAVDFINSQGINGEDPGQTAADFEALPEAQWLNQNAGKYNFYLTYPKDNSFGVSYEPWHWHWEVKSN